MCDKDYTEHLESESGR